MIYKTGSEIETVKIVYFNDIAVINPGIFFIDLIVIDPRTPGFYRSSLALFYDYALIHIFSSDIFLVQVEFGLII